MNIVAWEVQDVGISALGSRSMYLSRGGTYLTFSKISRLHDKCLELVPLVGYDVFWDSELGLRAQDRVKLDMLDGYRFKFTVGMGMLQLEERFSGFRDKGIIALRAYKESVRFKSVVRKLRITQVVAGKIWDGMKALDPMPSLAWCGISMGGPISSQSMSRMSLPNVALPMWLRNSQQMAPRQHYGSAADPATRLQKWQQQRRALVSS